MKQIYLCIVILMLAGLMAQPQITSYAQTDAPTSTPTNVAADLPTNAPTPLPTPLVKAENLVSFAQMGVADRVLRGPFDSMRVRFNLPTSWKLTPGASVRLDLGAYFNQAELSNSKGAALEVFFNSVAIQTVIIDWAGEHSITLAIPDNALQSTRLDGRNELAILLDAAIDCRSNNQTTITVRASSAFNLPHELVSPSTSLVTLPRPFYQESSFLAEPVTLIVPQKPSAEEMQAALTVIAAFGRFSLGKLSLPMITADLPGEAAAREQIQQGHLIFVGKPAAFPDLAQVKFPAPSVGGTIQVAGMQLDDGAVEMAISPWNPTRAVLYVGGNSDAGVVKAAQALSSGVLRTSNQPNLTLISDINASIEAPVPSTDRTLQDLGYTAADVLSGYGFITTEYQFFVPPGMVTSQDAYIDVVYTHSALLDFARSGLVLFLNGDAISSTRFSEETAKTTNHLRVSLPAYALRSGNNRLMLEADLVPLDFCSDLINTGLWTSIFPSTLIHLPLVPAQVQAALLPPDLGRYPYPFTTDPTLSNLAFVLPQNEFYSWQIAAGIAADLGKSATGEIISFGAYFDNVPEAARPGKDFILVGRATSLPIISAISDRLPAPFAPGSDIANEKGMRVTYRLPEGTDLGYLQLLASPWNENNTILAVMGSTDLGLQWAGKVLTDPRWRGRLSGNFGVVNDQQVLTSDTRVSQGSVLLSATAAPGGETTVVTPPAQVIARPAWLLPGVIASAVALVVVILGVLISNRIQKKRGG